MLLFYFVFILFYLFICFFCVFVGFFLCIRCFLFSLEHQCIDVIKMTHPCIAGRKLPPGMLGISGVFAISIYFYRLLE